jgi:hypothetical protein
MLGKAGEKWASGRTMGPTGNNYKVWKKIIYY